MTDAYDVLRRDWCDAGDMPRATCAHCRGNTTPVIALIPDRPWSFDGQHVTRRSGRDIFPTIPTPHSEDGRDVKRGSPGDGRCACGAPTRDNAYGCDHCSGELERLFAEAAWVAEQLDATITKQRAAAATGTTSASPLTCGHLDTDHCGCPVTLPWNDKAAKILDQLRRHLARTVKVCQDQHVRNQSPYPGPPSLKSIPSMTAWLLWRVDGLTFSDAFTGTLKAGLRIEKDALLAIDRGPDLMYLGLCTARADDGLCGGAVYARAGEAVGKCRACRAEYAVEARRGSLEKALDDMLCTPTEIAHLATYLGLPATRKRVRDLVYQWHRRGRITPAPGSGDPKFRYGDIAPLLQVAYPDDSKGA